MIEELLWSHSAPPSDVKCFTFGGTVAVVDVVSSQFAHRWKKSDTFISRTGQVLPVTIDGYPSDPLVELPRDAALWRHIIATCEALGAGELHAYPLCWASSLLCATGMDFARVDLLHLPDSTTKGAEPRLYFGELTFYPKGGGHRWDPPRFDQELGDAWCPPWDPHSPLSLPQKLLYDNDNFLTAAQDALRNLRWLFTY